MPTPTINAVLKAWHEHVDEWGMDLLLIAEKHGVSAQLILEVNPKLAPVTPKTNTRGNPIDNGKKRV